MEGESSLPYSQKFSTKLIQTHRLRQLGLGSSGNSFEQGSDPSISIKDGEFSADRTSVSLLRKTLVNGFTWEDNIKIDIMEK
jgi:hypothetical protein